MMIETFMTMIGSMIGTIDSDSHCLFIAQWRMTMIMMLTVIKNRIINDDAAYITFSHEEVIT